MISPSTASTSLQQLTRRTPAHFPKTPWGDLPWVTPGLLRATGTNHIKTEKQQSHPMEWQSITRSLESPLAVPGASEPGVVRRLRVTDHVSSNKWRSLHAEKEPIWAPGALCNPETKEQGLKARWQLAVPAHMGTQGWMASANHLLEHFPSQRSNKQHYVENKECTLACPSSDHSDLQPSENSNHRKRVTFIPTKYRHRAAAFTHI